MKRMRVTVTGNEGAKIQEALFALGYEWSAPSRKNVLNIPENCYIYCSENGRLAWDKTASISHYDEYLFSDGVFGFVKEGKWGIQ